VIKLENVRVQLGKFVLNDISLDIGEGEYFIVLGPTGSGKTVLLESIAGLNPVIGGSIRFKDSDVTHWSPEKRGVGIVYQDHALFPNFSVEDNILFGLKLRKKPKHELKETLDWLGELLGISSLLKRKIAALSGGEKQKVALARALSIRPEVLLLDEPLSALDAETQENVREELRKLHGALKNTIVHVTHDFEEAMALGVRIAVIGGGCLKQVGTPEEIFRRPNSEFVARFVMARNIFTGTAKKSKDGYTLFHVGDKEFASTTDIEGACRATIRPEDITVSVNPPGNAAPNCFPATVTRLTKRGLTSSLALDLPPEIICLVPYHYPEEAGLEAGQRVYITFRPSSVHLFRE
jgi:molybdate transport system ATP-binding protein/molybdate/tungstate transport system ATP-binding protein